MTEERQPVRGEYLDAESMSDQRLLMETFGRLAMGIQPLNQWAPVFANTELMDRPGLRCKAFTVWFPTMLDFVGNAFPEITQLDAEPQSRELADRGVAKLAGEVEARLRELLAQFSREEQLFINDRRLQNVHGLVSQFFRPVVGVRWFSPGDGVVYRERIEDEEYHEIMRRFYPTMQESTLDLLDRCVASSEWVAMGGLAQGEASMESLVHLAAQLGVTGNQ